MAAGKTDGAHGGFCARTDQTHLLDTWYALAKQRGEFDFRFGRGAEAQAVCRCGLHRLHNRRVRVAED